MTEAELLRIARELYDRLAACLDAQDEYTTGDEPWSQVYKDGLNTLARYAGALGVTITTAKEDDDAQGQ